MAVYTSSNYGIALGTPTLVKPNMPMGRQSHLVPSPATPVSSSTAHAAAIVGHRFGEITVSNSRKRTRPTSCGSDVVTPKPSVSTGWPAFSVESGAVRSDAAGHLPFVDTRYDLLGGLDTPTLELEAQYDRSSDYKEANFRRRWSVSSGRKEDSTAYPKPGLQLRGERNGQKLLDQASDSCALTTPSWSGLVCSIVGGVAGKMWEFCKTSAFQGFQAGGGRWYKLQCPARDIDGSKDPGTWEDMESSTFQIPSDREASPMPGMWPEPDYFDCQAESPQRRPRKRNRTTAGNGWIVVDSVDGPDCPVSTSGMAARKIPGPSPQQLRVSARPQLRKSAQLECKRSTPRVSSLGSPAVAGQHRRSSKGPLRTPSGQNPGTPPKPFQGESPMSAEAQRYAERMRREERQADASIRRLNDRLSAMIREGKEALGTKVEVVDDLEDDEGFFQ